MKRLLRWTAIAALLGSGAYVFVYLYRWEWNRALMALMLFVAVEIAVAVTAILERLGSLERKLEERPSEPERTLDHLRATRPEDRRYFRWLEENEVGVFIPVLLGAGAILSALAWAVERVSSLTARPALERGLARRLDAFALPEGGLLVADEAPPRIPGSFERVPMLGKRIAVVLALALLGFTAVRLIADLTQNQVEAIEQGTTSIVTLEVLTNDDGIAPVHAAESLWGSCRGTVPGREIAFRGTGDGGTVHLGITPGLGVYDAKRLQGCLEDARLDHVQAGVLRIERLSR